MFHDLPVTASSFVARLSIGVAASAADRRARIGIGLGDRPAPSLAALAVSLVDREIGEIERAGRSLRVQGARGPRLGIRWPGFL